MNTLRILVASPDRPRLAQLMQLLHGDGIVTATEGPLDRLPAFAPGTLPDVLIVDSSGKGDADLAVLEQLGQRHPQMSFIVLREGQSPEFLLHAMRAGVREVLPSTPDGPALKGALDRIRYKMGFGSGHSGKILAFVSCKGGSGATLLAANLAHALALDGSKTALLDLNLQFGDALLFLSDQKPPGTLADVARNIERLDAAFLASSMVNVDAHFSVLAAPEDPAHGMDIKPDHIDALLTLARSQYDFVVLDLGRGLDALAIRALDHADLIFPVLQTTMPYVRDGKRLMEAFGALGYPKSKVRLVVNRYQKGGDISLDDLEKALGNKVAQIIPNHYEATAASVNQGVPIARLARTSPVAKALRTWSGTLTAVQEEESEGWLARLFRRPQKA
ncbi:AAA family ATPase [Noviherbaspirillum denitrificans]|uniref:Response regulator receiver protein n=1 Tax=Noviherbaspirillum denitrificans TaxID=1968433 RepID=A0A254T8X9_9BURK|nr:AAA family ATPase [Noviherbaspirillum denitrificans]OWW19099.1 response regulator receiver protein [Noviherbaspirillum denitrificans]